MQEQRLYIMTTKKLSGIYTITNIINGKIYIGESLDVFRRWHTEHIPHLRRNSHYNKGLQNDFNEYGEDNFSFEILERYSDDNPISTKAKKLILEGYYITQFQNSGISLYNSENTLVEILNGNKIPQNGGDVLVCAIANVLVNYAVKECESFAYFEKYKTVKSVLFDYITFKKESQASVIKEFEDFLKNSGSNKCQYTHVHTVCYVLNGKKMRYEEHVVRDDKLKELEKMAVLFSEYRKKVQMEKNISSDKKVSSQNQYNPIKDGEVRFSLLFKEFAEKGILPKDYIYDKVREYMAGLGIITIKEMESKGVSKRVSFVTEDALNKNILRIVGCSKYGDGITYNYVFTIEGADYMRKLFSDLDESKKLELFTYGSAA